MNLNSFYIKFEIKIFQRSWSTIQKFMESGVPENSPKISRESNTLENRLTLIAGMRRMPKPYGMSSTLVVFLFRYMHKECFF